MAERKNKKKNLNCIIHFEESALLKTPLLNKSHILINKHLLI